MTALTPMRPERYAAYLEAAIAGYAEDSIACGRWPADKAGELSRADFMALLPQGLATPDNHLFEIVDTEGGSSLSHCASSAGVWKAKTLRARGAGSRPLVKWVSMPVDS